MEATWQAVKEFGFPVVAAVALGFVLWWILQRLWKRQDETDKFIRSTLVELVKETQSALKEASASNRELKTALEMTRQQSTELTRVLASRWCIREYLASILSPEEFERVNADIECRRAERGEMHRDEAKPRRNHS